MSSDPEQILAAILNINYIREDSGRCSDSQAYHSSADSIQESFISNLR